MEDPIEQEIKTEFEHDDAQTEEACENAESTTEPTIEQQPVEQTETVKEEENGNEEASSEKKVDDDEDDRKLFIGGLSWETQTNALRDYMSQFGEVDTCTIKMDSKTGRSRCFGFVIFKEVESVEKVLKAKSHTVDGRDIDAKKAEPQRREGKLFVGGIKPETTDAFLREYFEKYGEIEKMERPYDQKNSKPRGFCFITFKKDGPISDITVKRYHELEGKSVECKHADPPSRGGFGGGRGGRDGGRGGMGGWNNRFGYGGGNYGGGYGGGFGGGGAFGGGGGGGGYGVGYGGFGGGGFGDGYGAGYGGGFGGGGGGGYGNFGGGGYGFSGHQQSGYGKAPGGRGRHQNNFKPY